MLCGLWALLTATRITRGEEDSGRWDLLLAGRARLLDLVARSAATVVLAAAAIASGVGIALVLRHKVGPSQRFGGRMVQA